MHFISEPSSSSLTHFVYTSIFLEYHSHIHINSYGGYGGSDKSDDRYKYTYEVPEGWKSDVINKIEKGVTGIDNRMYETVNNVVNKNTKAYVITFPGYLKLKDDRDAIISDLAIADIQVRY